jgi:hypothetical protein
VNSDFARGARLELGDDLGEEVAFGSATLLKTNFKEILKTPDFYNFLSYLFTPLGLLTICLPLNYNQLPLIR